MMRYLTSPGIIGSLLLLLVASPATAFSMDDAAGDTQVTAQGAPVVGVPNGGADLIEVTLTENTTHFGFTWHVTDLAGHPDAPFAGSINYHAAFRHRDAHYQVTVYRLQEGATVGDDAAYEAFVERVDPDRGDARSLEVDVQVEADLDASSITATVPHDTFTDHTGAPPFPGRFFEDLSARARIREITVPGAVVIEDHVPDAGVWEEAYPVAFGADAATGFRFASPEPFRLSNGEATTFLFSATLYNDLEDGRDFTIQVADTPDDWDVRLPVPTGHVDGLSSEAVPVAVRIPFAHGHGRTEEVALIASDPQDADVQATLRVGVHFTDIPQPSGHHNRLYIHAREAEEAGQAGAALGLRTHYINTLEEDEADLREDMRSPIVNATLVPALGIGLHADPAVPSASEIHVVGGEVATEGLYVDGHVDHIDADGNATRLFQIGPSEPIDLPAGGTAILAAPVAIVNETLRYAYEKGAVLQATISLHSAEIAAGNTYTDAEIRPGSWFELPLIEYTDSVAEEFEEISSIRLDADLAAKDVNPGETVTFPWTVINQGAQPIALDVAVDGLRADWATVTPRRASLDAGEVLEGLVAIAAPPDAATGTQSDVLLEIRDEEGGLLTLARFVATVNDEIDLDDEQHLVPDAKPTKKSPALFAAPAIALAAWAVARRT